MSTARDTLKSFTRETIPTLDIAVMGALELFAAEKPPRFDIPFKTPLVVGSGNALATGKVLFADTQAVFATESSVAQVLSKRRDIDGAVLISASGGKHAVGIAALLKERGIKTHLLTTTTNSAASASIEDEAVTIFPKNREPYTYNTSTYLGMILSKTGEDAAAIQAFIESTTVPLLDRDFAAYDAVTIIVPAAFEPATGMFRTKFDELFGPFITGRVFTAEEVKHAKTVVTSKKECFIGIGVQNDWYGVPENRITLPLPADARFGALFAIGYCAIGMIQAKHIPYFANNIVQYAERASVLFGQSIAPIVE